MTLEQVLATARKHLSATPSNESSARFCMAQAIEASDSGDYVSSARWARKSLAHSVSIFSNDYKRVDYAYQVINATTFPA